MKVTVDLARQLPEGAEVRKGQVVFELSLLEDGQVVFELSLLEDVAQVMREVADELAGMKDDKKEGF